MQTSKPIVFFHITDPHFSSWGTELLDRDMKDRLQGIEPRIKEDQFKQTVVGLVNHLGEKKISAILLTGDYNNGKPTGGMSKLRDILKDAFRGKNLPPIVVVPGNHDVLRDSTPSSPERYKDFIDSWRVKDIDHRTPFLDKIDNYNDINNNWESHCFVNTEDNNKFIVIPINSCNWSHSKIEHRKNLKDIRDNLINAFNATDPVSLKKFEEVVDEQLGKLLSVDAALISDEQLEALRIIIENADKKAGDGAIKIALIHHHLLPVNSREEHKIFGDIINLGLLRQFLQAHGFNILLHGHKHNNAVYIDHIYHEDVEHSEAHEVLVISGGTINSNGKDVFRVIELENLPNAPLCKVSNVSSISQGQNFTKDHIKEFAIKNYGN